jgi:hypothetical protein
MDMHSPLPDDNYERYRTTPVAVKPFDPRSRDVARRMIASLHDALPSAALAHRGSTAWGIAGKGDIEIGVYPADGAWDDAISLLSKRYGSPGSLEDEYARFNHACEAYEIEIIVLRGRVAARDVTLHTIMAGNPRLLAEYEQVKLQHAYSRREYQRHKDMFFAAVLASLPADHNEASIAGRHTEGDMSC